MTKKDYELIERVLSACYHADFLNDNTLGRPTETVINMLSNALQADNPRFNRDKFLTACGIETEHKHEWKLTKELDTKSMVCRVCGVKPDAV